MESVIIPRPPVLPPFPVFPSTSAHSLSKTNNLTKPDAPSKPPSIPPPPKPPNIPPPPPKHPPPSNINASPPKPPPPPPPKFFLNDYSSVHSNQSAGSNGFRLIDENGDTGSVYSAYKQKIDQMFDSDTSLNTKNSVQARIDKMFADAPGDGGSRTKQWGCIRSPWIIWGLRVQYQGEKGDLEQKNSFPTIAVWSAVKFVINTSGSSRKSFAFLPLITDPDNIDKKTLFSDLEEHEAKYINADAHSPLFAVVMRKIGVHKQLECHGFVCQTSEDAIVIAATLYKSLMTQMRIKEKKPKNRNGVTCMSISSSIYTENSNGVPMRPPRRKRSTTSSGVSDTDMAAVDQASDTQPLIKTSTKKLRRRARKLRRPPELPRRSRMIWTPLLHTRNP
ncbi:hypothetical protein HHI36_021075 [Cryptolaemus montrouzieri]|uniref:PID domain-containing protein n=1 Tax=Cryptolaemus montrouzieri TaxID=559131 RepID=A0ABD2MWP5_9CUCU